MSGAVPSRPRASLGVWAVTLGLLSLVCGVIPVVGDLLAVPTGIAAVVLGYLGISRHDRGLAPRVLPSALGALLGLLSLFLVAVMLLATNDLL